MSSEQLLNTKNLSHETVNFEDNNQNISKKKTIRVDINSLLVKLREKEKSQRQENLLFFGVFGSIVITIGIIVTL
tara:strand:+ start:98 stop:322 length:225 start_codon:yes stop_codon:yes gene_type:complete